VTITERVVFGRMNGKERFAGAVLIITLAIGIVVDVCDRQQEGNSVFRRTCDCPTATIEYNDVSFRKLDVNVAGVEELEILPGIGPKKAEAIVDYRGKNGGFECLGQLCEVKGIGEKTLERIAPYVLVGTEVAPRGD
jgi:comEA protein